MSDEAAAADDGPVGAGAQRRPTVDAAIARLRRDVAAAEQARCAAEAADAAKTRFVAAASHDLRQPLQAVALFADALRHRCSDPALTPLVDGLVESVEALETLFDDLLDVARIDAGGCVPRPVAVPLRDVYARLRLRHAAAAFDKGLVLTFRGGDRVAWADPVLLERVLGNFVANAIRCTADGGVVVACRRRAAVDGDRLLLQVWDSGIGIGAEQLPLIWDDHYRAEGAAPRRPGRRDGCGLGLAIVKRLAAQMGTTPTVRSRRGHGSVFAVDLPAASAAAPTGSADCPAAGPAGSAR